MSNITARKIATKLSEGETLTAREDAAHRVALSLIEGASQFSTAVEATPTAAAYLATTKTSRQVSRFRELVVELCWLLGSTVEASERAAIAAYTGPWRSGF